VLGVGAGALVIPPVLNLLSETMGFAGAPGAGPNALPAPQASLISGLAQGVLGGTLRWDLIAIGGAIVAVIIALDEWLGARARAAGGKGLRLPPLGVAMGMYLPITLILPTALGALLGHRWDRAAERTAKPEFFKRTGVLLATGIIVAESLFGLGFAASVAALGEDPYAIVGDDFAQAAQFVAIAAMAALLWLGYSRTRTAAARLCRSET
jgi:putative OPT family oligopeptide transporter